MRNKKRRQHFQGRACGQKESSRNERAVGQPLLREGKWVALGAAAESSTNQEGNTNLEHAGSSGKGLCLLIQLLG